MPQKSLYLWRVCTSVALRSDDGMFFNAGSRAVVVEELNSGTVLLLEFPKSGELVFCKREDVEPIRPV